MANKIINIPILTRVEGEGALELHISDNKIKQLQLCIYEPPRLFEKFLEGREYNDVIDIVARICGICPVAYQMSAAHAIEDCFNVKTTPWIRAMRRVYYCGEWIESHSLHIHLLAAPDFFGYRSAIEMAKVYPQEIKRGLRLQSLGNKLIQCFGGRSVHPVGACVGGFYKAPSKGNVDALLAQLKTGLNEAEQLIEWVATLPFPNTTQQFTCVAISHPNEYAMNEGNIVSDQGLNIQINEFEQYFKEQQVHYSTALHCHLQGKPYLVGPLARVNINFDHLPEEIHRILKRIDIQWPSKNMFHSIVARAIEIYYGLYEAIRILENYSASDHARVEINPQAGQGFGCTEAPRGMLWHTYKMNQQGLVSYARIVPPTSQNQARIEEDLYRSIQGFGLDQSHNDIRHFSEMVIRNYDPCISCSTHFLNLTIHQS